MWYRHGVMLAGLMTLWWPGATLALDSTSQLKEWAIGWQEYLSFVPRMQASIEWFHHQDYDGHSTRSQYRLRLAQRPDCRLNIEESIEPHKKRNLTCYNPDYWFQLEGSPWHLVNSETKRYVNKSKTKWITSAFQTLDSPVWLQNSDLMHNLIQKKTFAVKSLSPSSTNPSEWVLNFTDFHQWNRDNPHYGVQEGQVTFGGDKYRVIRESKCKCVFENNRIQSVETKCEYEEHPIGIPVLRSFVVMIREPDDGPIVMTTKAVLTIHIPDEAPSENSFRLPSFGISEPESLRDANKRAWATAVGVVLVFLFLGWYFVWRKRRLNQSSPSCLAH